MHVLSLFHVLRPVDHNLSSYCNVSLVPALLAAASIIEHALKTLIVCSSTMICSSLRYTFRSRHKPPTTALQCALDKDTTTIC